MSGTLSTGRPLTSEEKLKIKFAQLIVRLQKNGAGYYSEDYDEALSDARHEGPLPAHMEWVLRMLSGPTTDPNELEGIRWFGGQMILWGKALERVAALGLNQRPATGNRPGPAPDPGVPCADVVDTLRDAEMTYPEMAKYLNDLRLDGKRVFSRGSRAKADGSLDLDGEYLKDQASKRRRQERKQRKRLRGGTIPK
jgi:hypothetical protein